MINEERISKIGKHFSVGSKHPCRVVQFNYMDNAVVVSLQKYVCVLCVLWSDFYCLIKGLFWRGHL